MNKQKLLHLKKKITKEDTHVNDNDSLAMYINETINEFLNEYGIENDELIRMYKAIGIDIQEHISEFIQERGIYPFDTEYLKEDYESVRQDIEGADFHLRNISYLQEDHCLMISDIDILPYQLYDSIAYVKNMKNYVIKHRYNSKCQDTIETFFLDIKAIPGWHNFHSIPDLKHRMDDYSATPYHITFNFYDEAGTDIYIDVQLVIDLDIDDLDTPEETPTSNIFILVDKKKIRKTCKKKKREAKDKAGYFWYETTRQIAREMQNLLKKGLKTKSEESKDTQARFKEHLRKKLEKDFNCEKN